MANNSIREFKLANLIKEAVTLALYEQKLHEADPNMMAPPTAPPQQNAGPVPPAPQQPPMEQAADPMAAPPQQNQPLTVDTMIERLNVIRGGRSFTDPEIYGQLTTFFKRLAPEQIQGIDQFLQDLSKIVVNVEQQPQDPNMQQTPTPSQQQNSTNAQGPISPNAASMPQASGGPVGGMSPV